MSELIECANCGEKIGKLETAHVYKGEAVCSKCRRRLEDDEVPPPDIVPLPYESPTQHQPPHASARRDDSLIRQPTVIEQTAKRWKVQILISSSICIVGATIAFLGIRFDVFFLAVVGVVAFVGGAIWTAVARLGAWWNHG